METLFNTSDSLGNNMKISGKVNLSGYLKRFEELKPFSKKAIIILYSEQKVVFKENKIFLIEPIRFLDYDNTIREWMRAADYLGVVFAKSNEDHLNYFLGVEIMKGDSLDNVLFNI